MLKRFKRELKITGYNHGRFSISGFWKEESGVCAGGREGEASLI